MHNIIDGIVHKSLSFQLLFSHANPHVVYTIILVIATSLSLIELLPNLLFTKSLCLHLQHSRNLIQAHLCLVPNRHHALGYVFVIFPQKHDRQHDVVNIAKN